MLLLAPAFLLIAAALAIFLWQRFQSGFGVPWLTGVALALVTWGLLLWLRFRLPLTFSLKSWSLLGESSDLPAFLLDGISWPYAFALAGIVLAILLTASARLEQQSTPTAWAASLAVIGIGMLAVVAANPLTLVAAWTAIDIVEVVIQLRTVAESRLNRQVVLAFGIRILGTLALIWAILFARSIGVVLNFNQIPPEVSNYVLLAVGLRLGIISVHLPYTNEIRLRRGLGTTLRMVASATSLVLLARLPGSESAVVQWTLLPVLAGIAAIYGGLMWLFASNALDGRVFWQISLGGMAVMAVIGGNPLASISWGLMLLLPGSLLFLFSNRQRSTNFLLALGILGVIGLPFTPAGPGWLGVWQIPFSGWNVVFLLAHAIILAGFIRQAFQPADDLGQMDRWVQSVYTLGLLVLVVTQWTAAYLSKPSPVMLSPILLLPGAGSVLLVTILAAVYSRVPRPTTGSNPGWLGIVLRRVGTSLAAFFRFRWLLGLVDFIYRVGRWLVRFATQILEGEGGVLWALLLLMLLISLIRTGGR